MDIVSFTSLCLLFWSLVEAHSHKREFPGVMPGECDVDYFVVAFPINSRAGTSKLQLLVTTMESELVPFSVETLRGYNIRGVANISTAITIDLPDSFEVINRSERDKGIRISAGDKQIAVYGLTHLQYSSAIFSALPCSRQTDVSEYEYYGVTYEDGPHGYSELLFVACEDSTTVRIGSEIILLNEMETYLYTNESDLTGMRVVSDKPISLFSGHQCNNIPTDVWGCDIILEQLPNTAQWGKLFLSASLHTRTSDDIYSVVSSSPGTSVTFACTGQSVVTLTEFANNHETVVMANNAFCAIESNNPILVVQYALSHEADDINIAGDPFMMTLPSIEQYSNNYPVIVPSQFTNSVITVYVPPEYYQPEKIFVNEMSQIDAIWTKIPCKNQTACGYTAYIRVGAGKHSVYHYNAYARIGVSVYGFASYIGYGYPAIGVDTIEWHKVNDFAVTSSYGSDYHQILKFNPLMISDGNSYKCAASVHYMDLHKYYEKNIELVVSLHEVTMVIRRSHIGTVYAGTEFTLISDISFSDVSGVDVEMSLDILWTKGSDVIVNDSRTTVSGVSGSGTSYTASLSFSPITTSDSGQFTANVTVRLNLTSQYVQRVTSAADDDFVTVEGSGLPSDPIKNKSLSHSVIFIVAAVVVLLLIILAFVGAALFFRKYIGTASKRNPTGNSKSENKRDSPMKTSGNEAYGIFKQKRVPEKVYELIPPGIKGQKSPLVVGTAIKTTDNEAYGAVTEQGKEPEAVYELIDSPSKQLTSSGNQENMCERPSLPPRREPLPIPLPVPETAKEEEVYETI